MSREYIFYTDGGCEPNPGFGSWAFVQIQDDLIIGTNHGFELETTNNRMEYNAILEAIRSVEPRSNIKIYTDSMLAVDTFNTWVHRWVSLGWRRKKKSNNSEIKNIDLVKSIYSEMNRHESVQLIWVRGHSGVAFNEECDRICEMVIRTRGKMNESNLGIV